MRLVVDAPERLDKFLAARLAGHTRSRLQRIIADGKVLVEGRPAAKAGEPLKPGWVVELDEPEPLPPHDLSPAPVPLRVLFEDADLLVVDKPRGLATHPAPSLKGPSLVNALLARGQALSQGSAAYRPGIVHRLDKDTTGLLIVAKTDAAHAALASEIERKEVDRVYVALVDGEPFHDEWTVDAPLGRHPAFPTKMAVKRGGKRAVTHVKVLRRMGARTLLACRLETGRTHQIRVHLASCSLPVVGDPLYGNQAKADSPLQLHAALLRFRHPSTGASVTVYAEPPEDFSARGEVDREEVEHWT